MKCHHPDIFCAALLNAQPMGFYAPAQIVRDAREHGVEVRPVCINAQPLGLHAGGKRWRASISPLRLGLRMVKGLANAHGAQIARRARWTRPSPRSRMSGSAPACRSRRSRSSPMPTPSPASGLDRRQALWRVRGLGDAPLPLFAAADARRKPRAGGGADAADRRAARWSRIIARSSCRCAPIRCAFLRPGARPARDRAAAPTSPRSRTAPGSRSPASSWSASGPGKGNVTFVTLEDETGIANAIVWQRIFEAQRRIIMSAAMIAVRGTRAARRRGHPRHHRPARGSDAAARQVGDDALPAPPRPRRRRHATAAPIRASIPTAALPSSGRARRRHRIRSRDVHHQALISSSSSFARPSCVGTRAMRLSIGPSGDHDRIALLVLALLARR